MTERLYISEDKAGECKPLMDACTPFVYRHNAFRITGLLADASVRDIKRRIDDLKHAEEMGDADEEHSHAFALRPPPSLEHIREAALRLQDPERRIVEEFFWFWPLDWDDAKHDTALHALSNGDKKSPYHIWTSKISEDHSDQSIISKHNLAVLYQMTALDGEIISLERPLTKESLEKLEKYWRTSFVWWETLADSEPFWSLVSARIRMLDDPRLTTGFARRMRATFPEALDKINALLALRYIENGSMGLAQKHIAFMQETHRGLDDVSKTLATVTNPLITRIRDAVDRANQIAERSPVNAADAAEELFETTRQPLDIIRQMLPPDDHARIDICDAVAETGLSCSNAFVREEHDWPRCLAILREAEGIAESEDSKRKIADTARIAQGAVLLEPILAACEQAGSEAERNPENALAVAENLLVRTSDVLETLSVSPETKDQASNETATIVMQCAIIFGNKTEKWNPCVEYLEKALAIATDQGLKEHITRNLLTAQHNTKLFGNITPISSAPSLSTFNGTGFTLYGATNHDEETGSHLSTYYFVFLAIPVFPIRRYRVIPMPGGYHFLGKAPLRPIDKCHLFISFALMALMALWAVSGTNSGNNYKSNPSSYSAPRSSYSPPVRSILAQEIEDGKARARQLETQIESIDNQIEEMERQMNSYQISGGTYEYNRLVPAFNSLVDRRNAVYYEYSRLIDEVNAKVNRYNSGAR